MNTKFTAAGVLLALALAAASVAPAQTIVSEDFTRGSTSNSWYYFNGACLTASTANGVQPTSGTQGQMPGCESAALQSYYNENQDGGYNGVAGNATTLPDPLIAAPNPGEGALRFTNGYGNLRTGRLSARTARSSRTGRSRPDRGWRSPS